MASMPPIDVTITVETATGKTINSTGGASLISVWTKEEAEQATQEAQRLMQEHPELREVFPDPIALAAVEARVRRELGHE